MRWLRLWTDVVDDPKLLLLSPDDRWYYIALLALKREGMLDDPGDSPDVLDRKVSLRLRLDHRERDEVRRRLMEVRLIDKNWQPKGWDQRQFAGDLSTDRVRRWRADQSKRSRNVSETGQIQITDTDSETDKTKQSLEGERGRLPAARAGRLPEDFSLTPERRAYAEREGINPGREFEKFRDHWRSASGATSRKHDWDAAWRNWCRRAAETNRPQEKRRDYPFTPIN